MSARAKSTAAARAKRACVRAKRGTDRRRALWALRRSVAADRSGLAVDYDRFRREHLPAHQPLGEGLDRRVVHQCEGTQVLVPHAERAVADVAALALDGSCEALQ